VNGRENIREEGTVTTWKFGDAIAKEVRGEQGRPCGGANVTP
jgi:hypothetical protein